MSAEERIHGRRFIARLLRRAFTPGKTWLRFTRKGGISFGLDGTPQGEVEVQIRFGNSPDLFCTRFAAPSLADDTPTRYESTDVVFMGCPTPVPAFCGPCDPPGA